MLLPLRPSHLLTFFPSLCSQLSHLRHGPVQAVLDPPLVHQQAIENPFPIEIFHRLAAEGRALLLVVRQRHAPLGHLLQQPLGILRLHHRLTPLGLRFDLLKRRRLHPFRPAEPPREVHDPLRQQCFHEARRRQLLQHPLPVKRKFLWVFSLDDHLLCPETMLDGILGDDGFALRRPRPGGFLGIGTIGVDLRFGSHVSLPTDDVACLIFDL